MKMTGKVLKDMGNKVIAEEIETPKGAEWVYKSTPKSELEFMQGVTIIAL